MRDFHDFSDTAFYLCVGIVALTVSAGNSAIADVDLGSHVQGIHGGDSRTAGIHGGDSRTAGIHGGDSRTSGIHGGDSRTSGIHGGDSRTSGIHGGDSRTSGIHGGDRSTLGIHGGDSRTSGIHGGDSRTSGIHGGDSRTSGIHGGDSRTSGIHGGDSRIFESAAMGPVESMEIVGDGYELSILGQTFVAKLASIAVTEGDYVLAAGSGGSLDILMPIGMSYIAGASPVLVRGTVNNIEPSTAELTVGGLSIDYSVHLSTDATFSLDPGELVEFMGVQPLPGGDAILNIQNGTESYLRGIHGGDSRTRGIHGGDNRTSGIHGGDIR